MAMARDPATYYALIEATIEREMDLIGEQEAIELASAVDGLRIDANGTVVELDRDGVNVLGEIVDAYVDATGDVAAFIIARRLEHLIEEDIRLPENVRRHI